MPCLEISVPKLSDEIKQSLTYELTKAFDDVTPFGAEIFGIRYHEYEPHQAATGGTMWDGRSGRPYLHMLLYIPRISRQVKQQLVERFSAAMVDVTGKENWQPVIHIDEHPYDNVGVEGKLLSDAYEACANRKFYYEVKDE